MEELTVYDSSEFVLSTSKRIYFRLARSLSLPFWFVLKRCTNYIMKHSVLVSSDVSNNIVLLSENLGSVTNW